MRTLALLLLVSPLFANDYDVVIRHARVIDGSGNPWFRADLAVKDGRIAAIGRLAATATRTIDARERSLAPGFIDMHPHTEGGVEKNPRGDNFLLDGVTTVITGNSADLVLFDPVRVQDKSTYAQPHQYSQGFDFVLVNGQIVVDDGKLTAARPGQPLRHL